MHKISGICDTTARFCYRAEGRVPPEKLRFSTEAVDGYSKKTRVDF